MIAAMVNQDVKKSCQIGKMSLNNPVGDVEGGGGSPLVGHHLVQQQSFRRAAFPTLSHCGVAVSFEVRRLSMLLASVSLCA